MSQCSHCKNGYLGNRFGQDVECINGVLIDIDVFHEGWQTDLCYPVAPCHPDFQRQVGDPDWTPDCDDVQQRLSHQAGL